MSDRLSDLQDEAQYIERVSKNIDELRKQHRASVIEFMREVGAPIKELAKILLQTKGT